MLLYYICGRDAGKRQNLIYPYGLRIVMIQYRSIYLYQARYFQFIPGLQASAIELEWRTIQADIGHLDRIQEYCVENCAGTESVNFWP